MNQQRLTFLSILIIGTCAGWALGDDEGDYRPVDEADLPADLTLIDFDTDPDGNEVRSGQDLTRLYVSKGCTLHSAFDDSAIVACSYLVRPGKRLCAGNRQPLYQGTMTIKFNVPSKPDVAGGVHYVAFYIAYVEAKSIRLVALDDKGKPLGEPIRNKRRGNDFFSVFSRQPIAAVEIRLDPKLDRDMAIDDLRFDQPRPLPGMPLP